MRKLKNNELKRITIEEFKIAKKKPIVIILDNVRSSHNVGSIFRTSDAFLIKKIILCGITPTPPSNDIRKSALGSTDSVDWEYQQDTNDAIDQLKKDGHYIVGVEQVEKATNIRDFQNNKPLVLIFGHEVNGVAQETINKCDEIIEIPQFGTKHSLNISVSAGIVIWKISDIF
jgi:23S rRNA (guanosine2251-2'-O)-methyltransferase|tara:strand:- start:10347 stop:10865 length:519 start_codon:yes stop_codon:yes gene_type:complete